MSAGAVPLRPLPPVPLSAGSPPAPAAGCSSPAPAVGTELGPAPATPPAGAVPANPAARRFEETWPLWYAPYGQHDGQFRAENLPARIRHTPAYLTMEAFVEPLELGPDGILRLEADHYRALCWWDRVHPVVLFVLDSETRRWCLEPVSNLTRRVEAAAKRTLSRPDRRERYAVPGWLIFDAPQPASARR
jgi:hypothetical protein